MRRSEREIKDRKVIDDMIRRSRVCRLAMCDEDRPYVVPLINSPIIVTTFSRVT